MKSAMALSHNDKIIDALKKVYDPELRIDVWTLGLIYDVKVGEDGIDVLMTFTTPFCPYAEELLADIEKKLEDLEMGEVRVNITFDPPWEPSSELVALIGL